MLKSADMADWYDKVFAVAALIRLHLKVSDYDSILYADYWLRGTK